jgi:DNA-binding Lrp family transcriptional regulator
MAKRSSEQIHEDEKTLLFELAKNSKDGIETIAKKCGFSRQKVWRMIKELEEKKLIWGNSSIFDEEKIGLKHFLFIAKRTSNKIDEKIIDTIISRKLEDVAAKLGVTIESSCYVHGEYDWVLTATTEDIIHAKKFSDLLIRQYPGLFEKITILQTLVCIKKQFILNPEREKLKNFL